jgi:hypothetical protein
MQINLPFPTFNLFIDFYSNDELRKSYKIPNLMAVPSVGDFVSFDDGNCGYVAGRHKWHFSDNNIHSVLLTVRETLENDT